MASKQISTEEWREFLGNEATELSRILSPYAELIFKSEGWKPSMSPTNHKRMEYKGAIVEFEKLKEGGHRFFYVENGKRSVRFMDILRDNRKDASDNFEHVNKARKYAFKYDAGSYKKFLSDYPEIADRISRHSEIDTPDLKASRSMAPKTYQELAQQFLFSRTSIFHVAGELGYEPKELKAGVDFIPKEVTTKVLQHVDLKDVIEKFQGKMFFQDNQFAVHSPFAQKGEDALLKVNSQGTSYYCEATKESGNAISYLMGKVKYGFVESVNYLAAMYHIDMEKELAAHKATASVKETPVYYVKGENKLLLKVQDNGVQTFYDVNKQQGGNVIKFLEYDSGHTTDQAFGFLKDLYSKRLASGNVVEDALVFFVKRASELPDFDKVLKNENSLVNVMAKECEAVNELIGKIKASPPAKATDYSLDSVADKFKVAMESQVMAAAEPSASYGKGKEVQR